MAAVNVARVGDIPPGTGKVVSAGGKTLAVFNVNGVFHAIDNACTHVGGPLGEGRLEGTVVTCPWHGSQFDVTTGQLVRGPARRPEGTYPTRVEGDNVVVDLA